MLPPGRLRPQPGREEGEDAGHLRAALRRGRLPGCGGGVRRQRRGPVHGGGPGGQGQEALRDRARGAGGRQGDADDGADPQGPRACGARLDLGPEDRGHPKAAEGRRPWRSGPRWNPEALVPDAVAEITGPDFPGERLMVCLNPRLREERRRKREDLLEATERTLANIAAAAARRKPGPANRDQAMKAIGREANRRKMEKHFEIAVTDDGVSWSRREGRIAEEARLDGIYVIRTSLESASLGAEAAVEAYKSLASVERAFLTMKASRLRIRPVHVYSEDHVRAHVFLCMLAYHVEWHMRRRLAPILFEDDDREGARARRSSPVEKAEVSESAKAKADTKRTPDGLPVHSFTTLLSDLGTLTLNHASIPGRPDSRFLLASEPTELQARAFELLGMDPDRDAYISVTA